MADETIHAFERAGLGKAPFYFVRVEIRKYQACHGAPVQPGGSCAFCGEGIMECCVIRSSDGQTFIVGNVCVHKTGDAGLINLTKRAVNKLRTEARHKREAERIDTAIAKLAMPEIQAQLTALSHPVAYRASLGATRLDWANWMLANAGNKGKIEVARFIDTLGDIDVAAHEKTASERVAAYRDAREKERLDAISARDAKLAKIAEENQPLIAQLEEYAQWSIDGGYADNFAANMINELRRTHYADMTDRQKRAIASVLSHGLRGRKRAARYEAVLDFLFLDSKVLAQV